MKGMFYFFTCLSLFMVSCTNDEKDLIDMADFLPARKESGQYWGMLDKNGKMEVADWSPYAPSAAFNGVFTAEIDGSLSLFKISKKPSPIKGCENIVAAGYYIEGLIPVTKRNQRITLINDEGETIFTLNPINRSEIIECFGYFTDGLLIVRNEDYKFGAVDKSGKTIIEPKYDRMGIFRDGVTIAEYEKKYNSITVIIDSKGHKIAQLKANHHPVNYYFKHGLLLVRTDDYRYGFYDTKGNFFRLSLKANSVEDYNSDYIVYKNDDGDWGVLKMNKDNQEVLILPQYESIALLPNNKFLVKENGCYYVINKMAELNLTFFSIYDKIIPVRGKFFKYIAKMGSYFVLLDGKGERINNSEFYNIGYSIVEDITVKSDYFNDEFDGWDNVIISEEAVADTAVVDDTVVTEAIPADAPVFSKIKKVAADSVVCDTVVAVVVETVDAPVFDTKESTNNRLRDQMNSDK